MVQKSSSDNGGAVLLPKKGEFSVSWLVVKAGGKVQKSSANGVLLSFLGIVVLNASWLGV